MANISLTATCNRACRFCFARDSPDAHRSRTRQMTLEHLEQALNFLERSEIAEARLLGGEPTLHPEFDRVVDRVLQRGLRIVLFTGGLIPEKALRRLETVPEPELTVLLNVAAPSEGAHVVARQHEVCSRLGQKLILGITIDTPGIDLGFLLERIGRYGLGRAIRLGLAHPVLGGSNRWLHPRHYKVVGIQIVELAQRARERGVRLDFDCGFVPCMFPDGAIPALGLTPGEVGLRCNPMLDLLPDGRAIPCYPLAAVASSPVPPDGDAGSLRRVFSAQLQPERAFRLCRDCEACGWFERDECSGGCLAASLSRVQRRPFAVAVPAPA